MDNPKVTVVVGTCAPERSALARLTAQENSARHVRVHSARPDSALSAGAVSFVDALTGARLHRVEDCPALVFELPSNARLPHDLSLAAALCPTAQISDVICAVDVCHLLTDLSLEEFVVLHTAADGTPSDHIALANITASQIECASTIVFNQWEQISNSSLSRVMSLTNHLAPRAQLRLDDGRPCPQPERWRYQPDPGWTHVLSGTHSPIMTDSRVTSIRISSPLPFHPERLRRRLDEDIDEAVHGQVVRSAGFCRLATRPAQTLQWDHVGHTIAFHVASIDDESGGELLTSGFDLALTGFDLDEHGLREALMDATLSQTELMAGPALWKSLSDGFPIWDPSLEED